MERHVRIEGDDQIARGGGEPTPQRRPQATVDVVRDDLRLAAQMRQPAGHGQRVVTAPIVDQDQLPAQAQGVELTSSAADYARERFGLEVFEGMLEDAPFASDSFDVVTFWDVLEHVYSPAETLARMAELLTPGGLVAINVPNWHTPERRIFGRWWAGYDPPWHLYVFTRPSLTRFLEEAGLEGGATAGDDLDRLQLPEVAGVSHRDVGVPVGDRLRDPGRQRLRCFGITVAGQRESLEPVVVA